MFGTYCLEALGNLEKTVLSDKNKYALYKPYSNSKRPDRLESK